MRACVDCGDPVSGRRKRCPECKRADHARAEKTRRDAVRERAPLRDDSGAHPVDGVVDYTHGGHKVPSFDAHPKPPPRERNTEVVDYTNGGYAHPGSYVPPVDYSQVPGWVRRDRVKAAQMAHQLASGEDSGPVLSWDASLQQVQQQAESNTIDISHLGLRGERPRYEITNPAAAGVLYPELRTSRPVQKSPGQRVPHIIQG